VWKGELADVVYPDALKALTNLGPAFRLFIAFSFQRATIINGSVLAVPNGSHKRSLSDLGAKWYLPQVAEETADDIVDAVLPGGYTRTKRPPQSRSPMYQKARLGGRNHNGDSTWQSTGDWTVISRIGGNGRHVRIFCWDAIIVTRNFMPVSP
jgi:hypothetical protein